MLIVGDHHLFADAKVPEDVLKRVGSGNVADDV